MSKSVGDYILREKIGKGSYADVYKGVHKNTGIKYAIKTIFKENLSDPKLLMGLESEIKIMREFAHENIVKLYEYFSSEKNFYLVLELCEGGDLSKYIKKSKRLSERVSHSFMLQIVNGLTFLQDKSFIHRDLKPANVLLTELSENATLKLADFGFAKNLAGASLAQTRCGTPLYMVIRHIYLIAIRLLLMFLKAPEILEAKDYDGKADIWSVGCIFYEMLVGVCPFRGINELDLLNNIKMKQLMVPKEIGVSKPSIDVLIKVTVFVFVETVLFIETDLCSFWSDSQIAEPLLNSCRLLQHNWCERAVVPTETLISSQMMLEV
jgi:serine/threonine-protein kinase ULK/ATG1